MRLSMIGERPDKDYSITSKQRWKWWEANVGKIILKGNFEFWEHLWQFAGLAHKQSVPTDKVFPFVNVYHCVCHCHYVHYFVHHCVCGSWCASLSLCASHGQWPCVLSGGMLINKLLSHKGDLPLSTARPACNSFFFFFGPQPIHKQFTHSTFFTAPVFEVDNYCTADCKGSKFCI